MYFDSFLFPSLLHVISFLLFLQPSTESSKTMMKSVMLKNLKPNNKFLNKMKTTFKSSMKINPLYILSIQKQ